MNRTDLIPCTIIAACTLHNIRLSNGNQDEMLEDFINEGFQGVNGEAHEGLEINRLEGVLEGNAKRDYLASQINLM